MSNIIRDQDLLKNLTDAQLARLMQKPSGEIAPFLVAAEGQRRQAIREQFSGGGPKESVVDTLTKQLANVPQNVNSPMKAPPNIPPPMDMAQAGIGALPEAQQMAEGGRVQPMWTIPSYGNAIPQVMDWVGTKATDLYNYATTPYSRQGGGGSEGETTEDTQMSDTTFPDIGKMTPDKKIPEPKKPRDESSSTAGTSPENKYKAQEAAFRKRIEELYGTEEPSNWDDAQKWFAMSQAIMQPGQNLMQSLAGAGAIYAGAESEQAAQQREADRAREEMMLKYDMDIYAQDRADAAAAATKADDRAWQLQKAAMPTADSKLSYYKELVSGLNKDIAEAMDPRVREALVQQRDALQSRVDAILNSDVPSEDVDRAKMDSELVSSIFNFGR